MLWTLALTGSAQEQNALPAFPSRAEAVTLDVVVVDKQGRPVRGLSAADFTVLEEGQPQVVSQWAIAFFTPIMGPKSRPRSSMMKTKARSDRSAFC